MEIRAERPEDHAAVLAVNRRAFGADHGKLVATLVDALRAADPAATSLVAVAGGEVVGHVMFTRSLLDAPPRLVDVQVLSPLAVAPERQRQGIGSALVREGVRRIAEQRVPLVFLEGDPRYYARFGFEPGGRHGFRKPSLRIPDAAFQVKLLPAYESWMTGTLVYAAPFWEHDAVGLR
ncbi:MAG TPA: N-acetyltransferase [Natronosporangium sp.]